MRLTNVNLLYIYIQRSFSSIYSKYHINKETWLQQLRFSFLLVWLVSKDIYSLYVFLVSYALYAVVNMCILVFNLCKWALSICLFCLYQVQNKTVAIQFFMCLSCFVILLHFGKKLVLFLIFIRYHNLNIELRCCKIAVFISCTLYYLLYILYGNLQKIYHEVPPVLYIKKKLSKIKLYHV